MFGWELCDFIFSNEMPLKPRKTRILPTLAGETIPSEQTINKHNGPYTSISISDLALSHPAEICLFRTRGPNDWHERGALEMPLLKILLMGTAD